MKRLFAALCALALAGCSAGTPRYTTSVSGTGPSIRVLLLQSEDDVRVRSTGPFQVQTAAGATVLNVGGAKSLRIRRDGKRLLLRVDPDSTDTVVEDEVVLTGPAATSFDLGGTQYPSQVRVRAYGYNSMLVLNVLLVESYLEGVVPHEIGDPGPDAYAAVRAQAIAARTYALSRIDDRRSEPFDVFAGVRDQVYRGNVGRQRLASSAIRDTRGLVLQEGSALASAYYCATCGGHTADIRRVWPQRQSESYLHGVLDRGSDGGSYCAWVHNFRWRYTYSGRDLGLMLRVTIPRELGVPESRVGFVTDVSVVERSPSGRVRVLEIKTTNDTFRVEGDRIRWVLMADPDNGRILPSTLFDLEPVIRGGRITALSVVGGGNGHGVGMCQNGAIGMARDGYSHNMILSHYYPGTKVEKRY